MVKRLVFVALHVRDLHASARFYRDLLGVPLVEDENTPGTSLLPGSHLEHSWRDGGYLHLALFPAGDERGASRDVELGFEVDDLEAVHRMLLGAGAEVLHGPREEPWGLTARYRDPDGNVVGLTQLAARGA